jgi:signal transduction histidine kinase
VHGGATRPRTVTDLPGFLSARLDLFRDDAARRGISLILAQDCPTEAEFDADRMGQAIDNLLLNAVQNTGPSGRVELSAQRHGDT